MTTKIEKVLDKIESYRIYHYYLNGMSSHGPDNIVLVWSHPSSSAFANYMLMGVILLTCN